MTLLLSISFAERLEAHCASDGLTEVGITAASSLPGGNATFSTPGARFFRQHGVLNERDV